MLYRQGPGNGETHTLQPNTCYPNAHTGYLGCRLSAQRISIVLNFSAALGSNCSCDIELLDPADRRCGGSTSQKALVPLVFVSLRSTYACYDAPSNSARYEARSLRRSHFFNRYASP